MMKFAGIAAAIASLLVASSALGDPYIEQFSSGTAGWQAWTVNDGGGMNGPAATFGPWGGNGGGYISGGLTNGPDRLYVLQPADAGNYQGLAGLTLTVDYKIGGAVTGPAGAMVRFYIGSWTGGLNYFVSSDAFSWDPNAGDAWTTYQVALAAANFVDWPNQSAHSRTFDQVITAPDDIGLVFCGGFTNTAALGVTGSGTVMIDNFGAVRPADRVGNAMPEPATLAFVGLGTGAVLLHSRRRGRGRRLPRLVLERP